MANQINVLRGEFKITIDSNESLYTKDLDSCVGLALIEHLGRVVKRGLAHINYGGTNSEVLNKVDSFLLEFLRNFQHPRAFLAYNRFKFDHTGNYENPMAQYIIDFLLHRKVDISLSDVDEWKHKKISTKEIALHRDIIDILYRDNKGKLINYLHTSKELRGHL